MKDKEGCKNCQNLIKRMKHPINVSLGKGSIMDQMGFVRITTFDDNSGAGRGMFLESDNGGCEMFQGKLDTNEKS